LPRCGFSIGVILGFIAIMREGTRLEAIPRTEGALQCIAGALMHFDMSAATILTVLYFFIDELYQIHAPLIGEWTFSDKLACF
jgi:hypothetical protein